MHNFHHIFQDGESPTTLLLLHGTGGNETDLIEFARQVAPSAKLLSPRGRVLENGMPRFFKRIAMGVFDEENIRAEANALADFVGKSAEHYGFDPKKVFAFGFSNGANIAAATLLLRPTVLAGAVLLRPMLPLTPENGADLSGVKVLMTTGSRDSMSPPLSVNQLEGLLRESGASVDRVELDTGHNLVAADFQAVQEFLVKFV